ncbi:MAG: diguanylate cyclase [Acidobacteriota bacterium]
MSAPEQFTVAIIDDDSAIRRLVSLFVRRSGFKTLECTTAAEAREILPKNEWQLAVLDRRLPDVDGVELCQELKSNPEFRNRYVIMLTGADEQQNVIEGLDVGADDYMIKPFQTAELLARIRAGKRIVDLQAELIESNRRLELLSITDGLTNLHNHRHFQDELSRAFEETERYGRQLSLALIDIDFFKKVNDTYGHASGDQVLKCVSKIFQESVRATDLVARYGGEEFAVMMPETDREEAGIVAEKVRALVEEATIPTESGDIRVTISVGLATVPRSRLHSPRELIEAADKSLYRAKRGGRNQVQSERRKDGPKRVASQPALAQSGSD